MKLYSTDIIEFMRLTGGRGCRCPSTWDHRQRRLL